MYRVLVVEDIPLTKEQLVKVLHEGISEGVHVDAAGDVEEALAFVRGAEDSQPYDVAILDFKLPEKQGEPPEIDVTVCAAITKTRHGTFIIHISGYPSDVKVKDHVATCHAEEGGAVIIDKSAGWSHEVLQKVRERLFGEPIRQQLEALFGPEVAAGARPRSASISVPRARRCATGVLNTLVSDIELYWADLNDGLRQRIRDIFVVKDIEGGVRVSVL